MASISGSVTIAGDPDDWIACAFDADTHAFAGVAAVSGGAYEITGLMAGVAYVVACRPKSGGAWASGFYYDLNDYVVPTNTVATPYTYKATLAVPGDADFSSVTLLLPMDGANGSTTFTDVTGKTVTRTGDVVISTAQSKFGGASAYFDGTGDYLTPADSSAFDLPGDFTYEMWIRPSSVTGTHYLVYIVASINYALYLSGDKLALSFGSAKVGATSISADAWHHIALTRQAGVVKMWLNGTQESTNLNNTDNISPNSTTISHSSSSFAGYIDDVRFTKGVARYTSTFTPPTSAHAVSAGTASGGTEPSWPTSAGATVEDGDVTWTNMGQLVQPLMQGPLIAA